MNNADDKFRLDGYEKIKITDIKEYPCPVCNINMNWWTTNETGISHCPRCSASFKDDEIKPIMVKRKMIRCNVCGLENYASAVRKEDFMTCLCKNVMAIKYNKDLVWPKTILTKQWNEDRLKNNMDDGDIHFLQIQNLFPRFLFCQTEKDFIVLRLLQTLAKQDDSSFNYYNKDSRNKVMIIYYTSFYYPYIGYIIWTPGKDNEKPILRQCLVLEEHRKKGYGTAILKYWHEYILKQSDFVVESANEITGHILVKLNYATSNSDGSIHGLKCTFIQCA